MTRRATFTQAELARAIRAAERLGQRVIIIQGMICIVAQDELAALPSSQADGENTCDKVFGERFD